MFDFFNQTITNYGRGFQVFQSGANKFKYFELYVCG